MVSVKKIYIKKLDRERESKQDNKEEKAKKAKKRGDWMALESFAPGRA